MTIKIACLVALGVTTSVVTSAIMSHVKVARADQVAEDNTEIVTTVSEPAGGAERVRTGNRSVARGSFQMEDPAVEFNVVSLAAHGHVSDIRPGIVYVWGVAIVDSRDRHKVLHQKIYDQQKFSMPESKETPIAFEETLDLPLQPGKYVAKLSLFQLDTNFGHTVNDLADPSKREGMGISGYKEFVINY